MSETTRADKVERHFRNSVRGAILDLMEVMDPGEKLRWGSLSYKELLSAAKNRLDAELLHETGFEEDGKPADLVESGYFAAGGLAKPSLDPIKLTVQRDAGKNLGESQVEPEAEVPESSVEMTVEASEPAKKSIALALPKETRLK